MIKQTKVRVLPLQWRQKHIEPYKCFVCGERPASLKLVLEEQEVTVKAVVCQGCALLPVADLVGHFLGSEHGRGINSRNSSE